MHPPVRTSDRPRAGGIGRIGAILVTSALALGLAVPAAHAEEEPAAGGPVAFAFDEAPVDGAFASGDARAKVQGAAELVPGRDGQGNAAKLGKNFWLDLERSDGTPLLRGLTAVTISYDSKPEAGNQGWTVFAPREEAAQTFNRETYLGVIDTESAITVERYANSSVRDTTGNLNSVASRTGWRHVDLVIDGATAKLYVNRVLVAENDRGKTLAEILGADGGRLQVGKGNWGAGEYFSGLVDNLTITPRALTEAEIVPASDALAQEDIDEVVIPNADDIRGNFGVPTTGARGSEISWEVVAGAEFARLEKGLNDTTSRVVVTRPDAQPGAVRLRGTAENAGAAAAREFSIEVEPKPAQAPDPEAYAWAFFTGEGVGGEKISLAASKGNNALDWYTLNDGEPIITSTQGERGLRDPFIIRSHDGDKFYMLATDLKIAGRDGGFMGAQENGSLGIEIWESSDLVTWSEQRHAVVSTPTDGATPYAGNTWAPEAYWDDERGTYVVYWASNLYAEQNPTERQTPTYNRMMYVTTDDFVSFSKPRVWIDVDRRGQAGSGSIDVSVQKVGDEYVRVYKDENTMTLRQEKSPDLLAKVGREGAKDYSSTVGATEGWRQMGEMIGNDRPNGYDGVFTGGEGPSLFRANEGDRNGYEYYLFADQPNYHDGPNHYVPMATTDIMDASKWEVIGDKMPKGSFPSNSDGGMPRHGTILPITEAEHRKLLDAYAADLEVDSYDPLTAETAAGIAPNLPTEVTLHKTSGVTQKVGVTWDAVPAKAYAQAGAVFEVRGVAKDATHHPVKVTVTVTERKPAVDGLIARYSFTQRSGAVVENDGGNSGPAIVQNQKDEQWTGDSLRLTGGEKGGPGNWVRLPNSLLSGADAATITTEVKIDPSMKSLHNFLWNIGAENDNLRYFFVGLRDDSVFPPRVGIRNGGGESTASTRGGIAFDRWTSITATIDGKTDTLRLYFDGVLAAETTTTLEPRDIADQTMNTIGKSPWPDPLFAGEIATFRVYDRAMTQDEVRKIDVDDAKLHEADIRKKLEEELQKLRVPSGDVDSDYIGLPTAGGSVTWRSSHPAVVGSDGAVTQPEQGSDPVEVTLTATLERRGISVTRETAVRVQPSSLTDEDRVRVAAGRYVIPPLLASGAELPQAPDGLAVEPVSATGARLDGNTLTSAKPVDATVTVRIARKAKPDVIEEKTFAVRVLPASDTARLAAYHRTPTTEQEANNADIALSMHLALPSGNPLLAGGAWTPLNENYGIFFPKTSQPVPMTGPDPNRYTRSLKDPSVFQAEEGGYGVVSTRVARGGASDGTQAGSVLVALSDDLRGYRELGLLKLDETGGVNRPTAVFDSAAGRTVISWTTDSGAERHQSFDDLAKAVAGEETGESAAGRATGSHLVDDLGIEDFAGGTTLTIAEETADALDQRFGRLVNTGYRKLPNVLVQRGQQIDAERLPARVSLDYSDGSTAELPIADWDLSDVDFSKPGTYTATGTVKQTQYPKPFAVERADPSAFKFDWNGQTKYLMIATNDPNERHVDQYGKAFMPVRIGDTLSELADPEAPATAQEVHLLERGDLDAQGKAMTGCFWAPEFHVIGGKLSILFMPCYGENPDYITGRASIMQLQQDGAGRDLDPADPDSWSTPEWILRADGVTDLNTDVPEANRISLDMTYFQDAAGASYYAWQQNCSTYIARLDPARPNRVTSDPVRIITPEYAWDNSCAEGPNVLSRGGKLLMTYAGSQVGYTYATGLAVAPARGADLLDPASWQKMNAPLLKSGEFEGEWQLGTGHGMWSEDEDGNIVHVFHAKTSAGGVGRDMFVRRVHFDAEGIPVLDMQSSEELASKTVELKVTVQAGPKPKPCTTPRTKPVFADTPPSHLFYRQIDWLHCSGYTAGIQDGDRLIYGPQRHLTRGAMAAMLFRIEAPKGYRPPKTSPFADVPTDDLFYKQIAWMHDEGLAMGVENPAGGKPLYLPRSPLTRGAMAAFIYRWENPKGYRPPAVSPVADMRPGDPFYRQVSWMMSTGLSAGVPAAGGKTEYRPKATLTRGAMAAFLYRLEVNYRAR